MLSIELKDLITAYEQDLFWVRKFADKAGAGGIYTEELSHFFAANAIMPGAREPWHKEGGGV